MGLAPADHSLLFQCPEMHAASDKKAGGPNRGIMVTRTVFYGAVMACLKGR
jgi:hypothetical protein